MYLITCLGMLIQPNKKEYFKGSSSSYLDFLLTERGSNLVPASNNTRIRLSYPLFIFEIRAKYFIL